MVDVARTHAAMSAELLAGYDNWCKVTLGRYALETVSLEDLQTEHEESVLLKNFVTDTVDLLPATDNEQFTTKDKLEADKLIASCVRCETTKSYDTISYLVGIDKGQLYVASPPRPPYFREDPASGSQLHKVYLRSYAPMPQGLNEQFHNLVGSEGQGPSLTDKDFREMYSPVLKSLVINGMTRAVPMVVHGYTTTISGEKTITGAQMISAGIFQRLIMLSVRFGVYDKHVALLDKLSDDVLTLRGASTEEHDQIKQNIAQMFAVAEEHKRTHPIELAQEEPKCKGIFRRKSIQ